MAKCFPIKKFWFNRDGKSDRVTILTIVLVSELIFYENFFVCPLWPNTMTTNVRVIDRVSCFMNYDMPSVVHKFLLLLLKCGCALDY